MMFSSLDKEMEIDLLVLVLDTRVEGTVTGVTVNMIRECKKRRSVMWDGIILGLVLSLGEHFL